MAMQGKVSSEPRYTIEQISLLHRLLRTGLTKQDIVHALDSMTKMDAEFQSSSPPVMSSQGQGDHSSNYTSPQLVPQHHSSPVQVSGGLRGAGGGGRIHDVDCEAVEDIQGGILQGMSQEVICGVENFKNVSDAEVENLFSRGPMAIKAEIRSFLTKYRLSQTQISMATGISQSYISSFLIHGFMMKRSTQSLLYRWYLGKKNEMEQLDQDQALNRMNDTSPPLRPTDQSHMYHSPNGDNYLPTFKRRERFTWRDNHSRILESYFNRNPYPNDYEREKITEACNSEHQQSGETVPDCKWVTSSKVYNWFANRRKDNNRRKRLGQRIDSMEDNCAPSNISDKTKYGQMNSSNLHIIEVHSGETNQSDDPSSSQDHVVVLRMGDEQQQVEDQQAVEEVQEGGIMEEDCKVQRRDRDEGKAHYDGMNTIYTLIEAVEESGMAKAT
ncbi:homeobox-containing protein 1-like [Asterias amurensis]|uniref:homeobox-containing protein 1-like n=1 Tax=Asterias amurensis TaxID=7602 RepID=UPI003AB24E11